MPKAPTILIVDDKPDNLSLLSQCLEETNFEIMAALNGEQALRQVEIMQPDLILLDVMMPGMNGFEACEKLKANPNTANIPVIFVTAVSDTEHKVKSFSYGAVDYICKPIQQAEVLARVHTHLALSRLNKELEQKNQQLSQQNAQLESFRTQAAEQLFAPLQDITGQIKFLQSRWQGLSFSEIDQQLMQIDASANGMIQVILKTLLNDDKE